MAWPSNSMPGHRAGRSWQGLAGRDVSGKGAQVWLPEAAGHHGGSGPLHDSPQTSVCWEEGVAGARKLTL